MYLLCTSCVPLVYSCVQTSWQAEHLHLQPNNQVVKMCQGWSVSWSKLSSITFIAGRPTQGYQHCYRVWRQSYCRVQYKTKPGQKCEYSHCRKQLRLVCGCLLRDLSALLLVSFKPALSAFSVVHMQIPTLLMNCADIDVVVDMCTHARQALSHIPRSDY